MLIKYEQIFIIYMPFFSVLADIFNGIWHLLVYYRNFSAENRPFSWKIPIFSNFGPLEDPQDINIFEKCRYC